MYRNVTCRILRIFLTGNRPFRFLRSGRCRNSWNGRGQRKRSAETVTVEIVLCRSGRYFNFCMKINVDSLNNQTQGRESIAAKLVANLITKAGPDRVLACDLHSGQSMGYFDVPVDHVHCPPVILDYLASKTISSSDLVVVSPDVGGVARARSFAKKLSDAPLAIVDKRRHEHNVAECLAEMLDIWVTCYSATVAFLIGVFQNYCFLLYIYLRYVCPEGDVKGKVAVMVDDMIDTAGKNDGCITFILLFSSLMSVGTIAKGAALLHEEGAREVYACCTHAVFSVDNPAAAATLMGLQVPAMLHDMVDGHGSQLLQRRQLYAGPMSKLRMLMICRMAKPEEVLIVEDENGNIIRESLKDNDVLVQYKIMRGILIYLSHLDHDDTGKQGTVSRLIKLKENIKENLFGLEEWKRYSRYCFSLRKLSAYESSAVFIYCLPVIFFIIVGDSLTAFQIERKHKKKSLWSRRFEEGTVSELLGFKESTKENSFGIEDWKSVGGQSQNFSDLKKAPKKISFGIEDWKRGNLTTFQIERKHQRKSLWSRRFEEGTFSQLFELKESTKENLFGLEDWKRDSLTAFQIERNIKDNLFGLKDWKSVGDSITTFQIERKHGRKSLGLEDWKRTETRVQHNEICIIVEEEEREREKNAYRRTTRAREAC
ncbi:hypothetical protein VNO80_21028 [Phaseolus coccineus]|uniref:ribose-phosphate diphosphokinase n=1 Tax=Phaseolus coccineus TaxID=3886 RepID=A0AAN9M747_PHACN